MRRCHAYSAALALIVSTIGDVAFAGFTITGPVTPNPGASVTLSDGSSTTVFWSNPAPRGVSYIEGTNSASLLQAAFANSFPNWSTQAVGALSGTLNISNHSAWVEADGSKGGDELVLQYTPGPNDPPLADLHWLQIVSTNAPIGNAPAPTSIPCPGPPAPASG